MISRRNWFRRLVLQIPREVSGTEWYRHDANEQVDLEEIPFEIIPVLTAYPLSTGSRDVVASRSKTITFSGQQKYGGPCTVKFLQCLRTKARAHALFCSRIQFAWLGPRKPRKSKRDIAQMQEQWDKCMPSFGGEEPSKSNLNTQTKNQTAALAV